MPQELSAKEQSLFRQVVRNYEDKQYKKGLKAADQILRKNPKHGDTIAMKALILNSQGKTDESFSLAKVALQCDMKSHVCWHVYGLLYRTAKNFEEAIKAYKFALKLEPESQQIQRDLAWLQIQMRDYQGYVVSRTAMLQSRPGFRVNWTALAIAHQLNGDIAEAERVLTSYEETLRNPPSKTDNENSEAVLYKNTLIAEQGDIQRALQHLESVENSCLDRLAVLELRAKYLTKLDRKEEAIKAYHLLINRNSEYKLYYDSLIEVMNIDPTDHRARKKIYDEYAEKFPRCDAARRLPLDFLESEDFREAAHNYLNRMLNKGVPSTFANLKHLYSNDFKKNILAEIVQNYLAENELQMKNNPDSDRIILKCLSAAYYYLAQHFNYHLSRDLDKAMEYVEQAIKVDSQNVDLHMTRARILKHYGDIQRASEVMEYARTLDERDRHINTKAAKYQLRNDESEKAVKTMGLFTRADTVGGPLADLHEMQCMWFLIEDGESFARQGKIGLALKRFKTIHEIFDVWYEDQFDFHSFSLRKGQIRAYVDMLKWENNLREHPYYTRAAISAIKVYISLHEKPLQDRANGSASSNVDASEKRKAAKKAHKEQLRVEREATAKKNTTLRPSTKIGGEEKNKYNDSDDMKLAATTDPLNEAMRYLLPLLQHRPRSIDTQLIGFEVYIRRKKYLLALKCLLQAISLDKDHPNIHEQKIHLKLVFDTERVSLPSEIIEAMESEFGLLSEALNLKNFNEEYLMKNKDCPRKVISALKVRRLLDPEANPKSEIDMRFILELPKITLDEALEGFNLLKSWNSNDLESYQLAAASKWPKASIFGSRS
ncbi:N-alpha-acetyltransferase 15, NatA auxiliary subunit [Golovinomyces cichoracearum]|uniref:N-alpha-acetyltransferase 15, NatA auxiliary subunit n=1 Tax=Golovinomyces cichoracearum TaxID=62708 RepID=A0A420H9Q3_9PEZI|nr:N-alpha-acetyltransferase 15, NatA auxiliary subunit [Golovinomyces cichoracearum]